MKGPWTFALLTIGIVLLSGDYFSGDDAVGVLAIVAGVCRFVMQAIATVAMAQIAKHGVKAKSWLPPQPPAPPKRYQR